MMTSAKKNRPSPSNKTAPPGSRRRAAHYTRHLRRPCPVAVGRDVPIAPPRRIARGGSPPRCAAWHPAPSPHLPARAVPLAGFRGAIPVDVRRSPSPPSPSRAAWHPAKFARALPTATGRCGAMGTSRPTAITPAWSAPPFIYPRALPGCRDARLGIVHTLRVLHAAALSAARCAAGPRTRRDVMIAPPFTHAQYSHAHYPRALPAVAHRRTPSS